MSLYVDNSEEHRQKILHLLGICQMIEFSLKLLLSRKLSYLGLDLESDKSSKQIYKGLLDDSLGTLIYKLKRISDNHELLEKLFSAKKIRNYLAHRALLSCYQITSDFSQVVETPKIEFDFVLTNNKLTECLSLISVEAQKLPSRNI